MYCASGERIRFDYTWIHTKNTVAIQSYLVYCASGGRIRFNYTWILVPYFTYCRGFLRAGGWQQEYISPILWAWCRCTEDNPHISFGRTESLTMCHVSRLPVFPVSRLPSSVFRLPSCDIWCTICVPEHGPQISSVIVGAMNICVHTSFGMSVYG